MAETTETTIKTEESKETPVIQQTRKEAIASAIETEVPKEGGEEGKGKKEEKKEETKTSTKTKEQEDEEAAETLQGLELIRALKDPKRAGTIIKLLAEENGYTKVKTEKAAEKAAASILEDLKESLGPEFEVLADKFAPAIEKILDRKLQEHTADLRLKQAEQEQEKLKGQAASAMTKIATDFFGEDKEIPDNVSKLMSEFMDKYPPTDPNVTVKEVLDGAFHFAVGKLGLQKVDTKKVKAQERNRNDASSRLANERSPREDNVSRPAKTLTRQEAIKLAIEEANKEMKG